MSISALHATRKKAYAFVGISVGAIVFISLVILFLQGINAFYSALLGGACWLLPNIYFARKVFANEKKLDAKSLLRRFYQAEVMKLCLIAILFVTMVKVFTFITMWVFLLTFIAAQITVWLAVFLNFVKGN